MEKLSFFADELSDFDEIMELSEEDAQRVEKMSTTAVSLSVVTTTCVDVMAAPTLVVAPIVTTAPSMVPAPSAPPPL